MTRQINAAGLALVKHWEGTVPDLVEAETAVASFTEYASDNQFAALVSFVTTEGLSALRSSTLLRDHNAKRFCEAQHQFKFWNHIGGQMSTGLTNRRADEAALYGKVST